MAEDEVEQLHSAHTGVLAIKPEMHVHDRADLSQAYTPGVAELAKEIEANPSLKDRYTTSGKLVAVVTDGSAVLGLGNIGPAGGLPIVEGKVLLYKELAGVDALPIAVKQVPVDQFVQTIKNLELSFAGIHLEDIAAPRCFAIEEALQKELAIPVYHDDQEGSAIVVLAGLINAAKVVGKKLTDLRVVMAGAGASGIATARLLLASGITHITLVDIHGVVRSDDPQYNNYQRQLAGQVTSTAGATLTDVIKDADAFIGLSDAHVLNRNQVQMMATQPIIFALANPVPEIDPAEAKAAGAAVIATGSSQYPNQVNNILAFPGLFRGLLKSGLKSVNAELETKIAQGLAALITKPTATKIVPGVFDEGVVDAVTQAVVSFAQQHK
ncbi:NAD-dependent malic enzyme [Lacticaseibacillus chiayiensis]|uniref:NAD-dependent malic enzyme n=1 Tax=Lacticaseibacillus chiayiensis TaxID=2100821 RepID=A0A4Q1UDT2_9LACO|nr:malic enzyme-like NAD(P)-binding protein [Lacticaseibacillus chiayiensis]QVI35771.1 NADP-dependent malic enzyme [Lacticaseibacillus chiayiensis]RXT30262.1 NAD-dependent malic enzyme [Lacticaseibacillus chiayiensis]UYN57608.1 NADP-dependent malic enzyme [Lacticaseibacillus chiayiensis]